MCSTFSVKFIGFLSPSGMNMRHCVVSHTLNLISRIEVLVALNGFRSIPSDVPTVGRDRLVKGFVCCPTFPQLSDDKCDTPDNLFGVVVVLDPRLLCNCSHMFCSLYAIPA